MATAEGAKTIESVGQGNRFEILVRYISEVWDSADKGDVLNAIDEFSEAIETYCHSKASFGVALNHYDSIETGYINRPHEKAFFYAEYYDGQQAPFNVCTWYGSVEKLEELLKKTSPSLFDGYLSAVTEWLSVYHPFLSSAAE